MSNKSIAWSIKIPLARNSNPKSRAPNSVVMATETNMLEAVECGPANAPSLLPDMLLLAWLLVLAPRLVLGQYSSANLFDWPPQCTADQVFRPLDLSCQPCARNARPDSAAQRCQCVQGFRTANLTGQQLECTACGAGEPRATPGPNRS